MPTVFDLFDLYVIRFGLKHLANVLFIRWINFSISLNEIEWLLNEKIKEIKETVIFYQSSNFFQ